jgi:long-chain acyl-CoA synthetase
MPEMVDYCGKRFRVSKRVVKTCYYGISSGMRKFPAEDVVLLEGLRCSGSAHGGCQKACTIFWREAWLLKVEGADTVKSSVDPESGGRLRARLKTSTGPKTYFCQASEILNATIELSRWERFGKCVSEVWSGNCSALEMTQRIATWVIWKTRRALLGAYGRGNKRSTPVESLNLRSGEWIEIKPLASISETLDEGAYNRGLFFTPAMGRLCGEKYRVEGRIEKIIVDGTGEMRQLRNTAFLKGSLCGCSCVAFGGCPRGEFAYWREIWLRRVEAASGEKRPEIAQSHLKPEDSNDFPPVMPEINPNGISELLTNLPERICDVIARWSEHSPDRPALVETSGTWTWRQLAQAVSNSERWLLDLGVRPGDRVLIVCENCRAFVAILLALAGIDAWPVLVNARLSAREVDEIRDHCGARRVIYTTTMSAQAREHAKRHGAANQNMTPVGPIAIGPLNESVEPEAVDAEAAQRVAALIYTSGTTGLPKGVMLTHQNLLFVAAVSARIRSLSPEDRLYGILPMSHAVGLSIVFLGSLLSGSTLYLASRFDPVAAIATLEKEHLTVVLGAPSMFSLFADYAKLKGLRSLKFPGLRIISSSGAPLLPALKAQVESLFGMALHNGYGVTECSPNISQAVVGEHRTDTSVGKILPGVEVQLVGSDQKPVADGEVGELWVRGPNVMKGYYRAPEETAAAINPEGWFNTRDLARLENGYLFIVGRTKELIIRFGENVYPAEVEAVLNSHPAVVRSAVIGHTVGGTQGGEEVVAYVQLAPSSPTTESDLAEHAAQHLAPYKRPSQILLVSSMALTPTGKIIKSELPKLAPLAQTR